MGLLDSVCDKQKAYKILTLTDKTTADTAFIG